MKEITISRVHHRGQDRILIRFKYDEEIKKKIKELPTAKYTRTYRGWHIAYTKEAYHHLKHIGYRIKITDQTGTIGTIEPSNVHTGIDSEESLSVFSRSNGRDADIDHRAKNLKIEIHDKRFFIQTPYMTSRVEVLKSLAGGWWNAKISRWVAKGTLSNLERLQEAFGYWSEDAYAQEAAC